MVKVTAPKERPASAASSPMEMLVEAGRVTPSVAVVDSVNPNVSPGCQARPLSSLVTVGVQAPVA